MLAPALLSFGLSIGRGWEHVMMPMNHLSMLDRERDQDLFESVTEEEIIHLWRSIKGRGLSEDEAWQAVVTGIALDMAFAKSRNCSHIEH